MKKAQKEPRAKNNKYKKSFYKFPKKKNQFSISIFAK